MLCMERQSKHKTPPPALSLPPLPWSVRISLSVITAVTSASRRPDGTINRRLLRFLELKSPATPTNYINGVKSSDVTVDASRDLWFRVYTPAAAAGATQTSLPVIVFYHGGGYVFLSPDLKAYDAVCRRFARKLQAVVVSVNYRLAPEHKYPAQFQDGLDVLKFLDDESNARLVLPENADPSRCFLVGDSAGGNLSHHVAKQWCESAFAKIKVIGVVAIQPFFGGEERTEAEIRLATIDPLINTKRTDWAWKALMPADQEGIVNRDHEVINVSGPRAADISKLNNFPAVLVVVAGFDSLQDWQRRYHKWLKRSGKEAYLLEFPKMFHAFYIFPQLAESGQLISEIKDFMIKRCSFE